MRVDYISDVVGEKTGSYNHNLLVWSASNNSYKVGAAGKKIGTFKVDYDGYVAYLRKDFKSLFPDFDPDKHNIVDEISVYSPRSDTESDTFLLSLLESKGDTPPPGVYKVSLDGNGQIWMTPDKKSMTSITVKVPTFDLKTDVKEFFTNKDTSGARRNKKGILLFGPPGNGKSTDIDAVKDIVTENNLFMFSIDSDVSLNTVRSVGKSLSSNGIILVMEEITERLDKRSAEELLNFLDGENSLDNTYTIATTNYPEKLPPNLVDRPSRFETFVEYKKPTAEQVISLGTLLGFSETESKELTGKDLSFDYASFIFSKAKRLDKPVLTVYEEEREHRRRISETFKGKIGF